MNRSALAFTRKFLPALGLGSLLTLTAAENSPAAADMLITNGGVNFRNNWPHGVKARIGLREENTDTPGKISQISVEQHMREEDE